MFGWGSQAEDESVPFPKTEEEFKEVARECLGNLVELYNQSEADGWTRINFTATYGEPDVELFERPSTLSPINTLKVYGSVPCTPEEALTLFWDPDITRKQEWEREAMSYDVIQEVSKDITVVRARYQAPFPVANREFVALRCKGRMPDGTLVTYGTSIRHAKCVVGEGGFLRATVFTGCFCEAVTGDPNKCRLVRIINLDPKGSVPSSVVNAGKLKAATSVILVRKSIDKQHPRDDDRRPKVEWEEVPKLKEEPKQALPPSAGEERKTKKSKSKRQKRREEKEKEEIIEEVVLSENEGDEEGFFDASNQFSWKEDFDDQTNRIATIVSSLQESIDRLGKASASINTRLTALEKGISTGNVVPGKAEAAALSFTRLSWGSIAFLVAWPLLVLSVYQFAQKARAKRK